MSRLIQEVVRIRNEHPDDKLAIVNDRVKGSLKVTRAFGSGFLKQVCLVSSESSKSPSLKLMDSSAFTFRAHEHIQRLVIYWMQISFIHLCLRIIWRMW